jgi:sugar lactone lactonase YvrE
LEEFFTAHWRAYPKPRAAAQIAPPARARLKLEAAMADMISCLAPVGDQCGEAATWSPSEQALYWTDVNRFLVHRRDWVSGAVTSFFFDEPCVALMCTPTPGEILVALGSRLICWRAADDHRRAAGFDLPDWPAVRLNDGRSAPNGDIMIGSMANNVGADGAPGACEGFQGALYRLARTGVATRLFGDIGISNTVCFSPDQRWFYFGDSKRNVIWRFAYDAATGALGEREPYFADFTRGEPDGSAIDADGYLWNCRWGGGCIVRVAPGGAVDRVIEMPVSNITTCCFAGADLRTLAITTAAMQTPKFERLAGGLFAMAAPVAGAPIAPAQWPG